MEATRERLALRLADAEGQLQEAKADRKENERDARMAEVIDRMKRSIPGGCNGGGALLAGSLG